MGVCAYVDRVTGLETVVTCGLAIKCAANFTNVRKKTKTQFCIFQPRPPFEVPRVFFFLPEPD